MKRTLSILALAALAVTAACGGENGGDDSTATQTDTSVVTGQDTMQQPVTVPTQDTVVQTTTTTTETDTVQGQAGDTTTR